MTFSDFVPSGLLNFFRNKMGWIQPSFMIGQTGAIWMDVQKPYELYNEIPQLKSVVDKKATMFANMEIKLYNVKSGSEVEDKDLQKLLQNPNPLQSQNEWLRDYKQQHSVYGNQFMRKNKVSMAKYPLTLFNISPRYLKPILTGKLFDQIIREDIISGYELMTAGIIQKFPGEEILFTKMNDIDNPIIGLSPIRGLQYPLTNTKLSYEYRNVLMAKRGALGMISNEGKDSMGAIPMKPEQKMALAKDYTNNYGIGADQAKVIITEASAKWTPMSFPTREMMLLEEVEANFLTIIDMYGMNVNLFSNKNATFENIKNSIIQVYQDTIIPEADLFTQALGPFIGIPEGTRLIASYEHLSIMKENKERGMGAIESIVRSLTQAVQAQILQPAQATRILQNELNIHLEEV